MKYMQLILMYNYEYNYCNDTTTHKEVISGTTDYSDDDYDSYIENAKRIVDTLETMNDIDLLNKKNGKVICVAVETGEYGVDKIYNKKIDKFEVE